MSSPAVEEVAGALPGVQRLDEKRDAGRAGERGGAPEVLDDGPAHLAVARSVDPVAGQDVQPPAAQPLGGRDRFLDGLQEMVASARIAQVPAVTGREIPPLGVEEDEFEPVAGELALDARLVHVVGEQELDRPEARGRRPLEPLEKRHLVEEHRQVGGVAQHADRLRRTRKARAQGPPAASRSAFDQASRRATSGASCASQARAASWTAGSSGQREGTQVSVPIMKRSG